MLIVIASSFPHASVPLNHQASVLISAISAEEMDSLLYLEATYEEMMLARGRI